MTAGDDDERVAGISSFGQVSVHEAGNPPSSERARAAQSGEQ
jgi:hypothetical protein